jgi:ABC-type multidrug transport system ATPase subunit
MDGGKHAGPEWNAEGSPTETLAVTPAGPAATDEAAGVAVPGWGDILRSEGAVPVHARAGADSAGGAASEVAPLWRGQAPEPEEPPVAEPVVAATAEEAAETPAAPHVAPAFPPFPPLPPMPAVPEAAPAAAAPAGVPEAAAESLPLPPMPPAATPAAAPLPAPVVHEPASVSAPVASAVPVSVPTPAPVPAATAPVEAAPAKAPAARTFPCEPGATLLAADGLSVKAGHATVARNITFEVREGEIVALLGPSGGGKSALVETLAGRTPVAAGRLTVLGHQVAAGRLVPAGAVTTVPRDAGIDLSLTVRDNLAGSLRKLGGAEPPAVLDQRVTKLMRSFALDHVGGTLASQISAGIRHQLASAMCLARGPRLAIVTDPGAGLDVLRRSTVYRALAALAAAGSGLVMVTHDPAEAEAMATRVIVLDGTVVASGTVPELVARYVPGSRIQVTPRDPADLVTAKEALRRMGMTGITVDRVRHRVAATLVDGPDGLARAIFRLKVVGVPVSALGLEPGTLAEALAKIPPRN